MNKNRKNSNWGGPRRGAGRPPSGIKKKKVSVSVETKSWDQAMALWDGKPSQFHDVFEIRKSPISLSTRS